MIFFRYINTLSLSILLCLCYSFAYSQQIPDIVIPTPTFPKVITPTQHNPSNINPAPALPNTIFNNSQNGMEIYEQDRKRVEREQLMKQQIAADIAEFTTKRIRYTLPSYGNIPATKFYRNAFEKLSQMNPRDFSIKDATFIIENAYYEEQQDYDEFNQIIKQTGNFLREKMDELGYDQNSNFAKNFILFQFFADTLEIKSKNLKHLPFEYDFDDYMGWKDWSKMFVHKLLETGKGQCNSLPRLYLILAEEIGAEAFLSLSPNHSYIRFRDEKENWYNVELTNGMFTVNSFILQSGYIKAEALQNEIYMQAMTKEQLFSQLLTDLAQGYNRKFGYDEFAAKIILEALQLYPNSINAHMTKANIDTERFEYAIQQLGINPRDKEDLQNIRFYPEAIDLLNEVNVQYDIVDNLGYEYMPAEAYENWLNSLQEAKQKQDDEEMKKQFNIQLQKTIKD